MIVANEHIRLAHQDKLAQERKESILEDLLEPEYCDQNEQKHTIFSTLLTSVSLETAEMDIEDTPSSYEQSVGKELHTNEQKVLEDMYRNNGSEQVSRSKLEFSPQWIIEKAVKEELSK